MLRPLIILGIAAWLFAFIGAASGADAVVISKDVPSDQLTSAHLRNALLGRVSLWSDGRPIVIVLSRSPASQDQLQALLGRDLDHLLRGWKRLVFTGGGSMPEVSDDDVLTIRHVASTPGAFAIIAAPAAADLPPGVLSTTLDLQPGAARPDIPPPRP